MKPIQVIFISLFTFLIIYFGRKLKQHMVLKVALWLILLGAIFFTVFQDSSTVIANYLGIGRGVDLIIYLSLIGLLICCVLLYVRIVQLERRLAEVVRVQAMYGQQSTEGGSMGEKVEMDEVHLNDREEVET